MSHRQHQIRYINQTARHPSGIIGQKESPTCAPVWKLADMKRDADRGRWGDLVCMSNVWGSASTPSPRIQYSPHVWEHKGELLVFCTVVTRLIATVTSRSCRALNCRSVCASARATRQECMAVL